MKKKILFLCSVLMFAGLSVQPSAVDFLADLKENNLQLFDEVQALQVANDRLCREKAEMQRVVTQHVESKFQEKINRLQDRVRDLIHERNGLLARNQYQSVQGESSSEGSLSEGSLEEDFALIDRQLQGFEESLLQSDDDFARGDAAEIKALRKAFEEQAAAHAQAERVIQQQQNALNQLAQKKVEIENQLKQWMSSTVGNFKSEENSESKKDLSENTSSLVDDLIDAEQEVADEEQRAIAADDARLAAEHRVAAEEAARLAAEQRAIVAEQRVAAAEAARDAAEQRAIVAELRATVAEQRVAPSHFSQSTSSTDSAIIQLRGFAPSWKQCVILLASLGTFAFVAKKPHVLGDAFRNMLKRFA